MANRLALVTGSTGFIGSHLIKHLASAGWDLRITHRAKSNLARIADSQADKVELDLSNSSHSSMARALEGVTHIFHVAGKVSGTPQQLARVNQGGTQTLIQAAAAEQSPPVFTLISSAAAGGPWPDMPGRPPSEPPEPISQYGKSKLAGERAAIAHRGSCPLTIVRPGVVFGEGDTEFIRILRAITKMRLNPMIGSGLQRLSMIDVQDLVPLIIAAASEGERVTSITESGDSQTGRGIYNASDSVPMSLMELGKVVSESLSNLKYLNLRLPIPVGFGVGAASEFAARLVGRTSTLNRDKIREAKASGWVIDPQKSISQLQWNPEQPLQSRLRELAAQSRKAGLI